MGGEDTNTYVAYKICFFLHLSGNSFSSFKQFVFSEKMYSRSFVQPNIGNKKKKSRKCSPPYQTHT